MNQTYQITLGTDKPSAWSAAVTSNDEERLLLATIGTSALDALTEIAERVAFHQDRLDSEYRGLLRQGIVPMPRAIQHTDECKRRRELVRAWYLMWPHHCKLCRGEGGKYYPGTREEPPDYDPCLCVNMALCPRCMLPAQGVNPWAGIAYMLYDFAHSQDRIVRQAYGVSGSPRFMNDTVWQEGYQKFRHAWYEPLYRPITELADQFSKLAELAEPTEMTDEGYSLDIPKPCIHCGFGFGHHTNDLAADAACYCEMGL